MSASQISEATAAAAPSSQGGVSAAADRPVHGELVGGVARCVRQHNVSPLTFRGTNTWILAAPNDRCALVVDPGPDDDACALSCEAMLAACGLQAAAVAVTHYHADHAGCADGLARRWGVPVLRATDGTLAAGPLKVAGLALALTAVPLPGHSSDSVALHVPVGELMVTGDVIFAQSPTMVCWPDGKLGAYLDSLDALDRYVALHGVKRLLTAHGPVIENVRERIGAVRDHRLARLSQVVQAVQGGVAPQAEAIVDAVYDDVPAALRPGAVRSVHAQLDYARETGLIPAIP